MSFGKPIGFQVSHNDFVSVDVGGIVLGWIYGCVNEVCMKVIGCGGWGCLCGGEGMFEGVGGTVGE